MLLISLLQNILTLNLLKSRELLFLAEKILGIKIEETKSVGTSAIEPEIKVEPEKVEKNLFELYLLEKILDQPNKIKAIKVVREIVGIELRAAKELIDKAPITIKKDLSKIEAEAFLKKCENIEAKFEIR